jgi:hypothetical protein
LHKARVARVASLVSSLLLNGATMSPFQRCPVRACSLVSSLLLNGATMSQESSLIITQSAHSVRQVLTAYSDTSRRWAAGPRSEKRTHVPQQTSGRAFSAVTFGYLSVECPFNKFYGINCRPSWVRNCSIASCGGKSPHQSVTRLIASSTVRIRGAWQRCLGPSQHKTGL